MTRFLISFESLFRKRPRRNLSFLMSVPWVFFLFVTPIRAKPLSETVSAAVRCEPLLTTPVPHLAPNSGDNFADRLLMVFSEKEMEELVHQVQTTAEENGHWADASEQDLGPNHLAFFFEVPVVKKMNDGILVGYKNLVNVLLNYLKSTLKARLLEALPADLNLRWYSDFKSLGLLMNVPKDGLSERAVRSLVAESVQTTLSNFDHLVGVTSPHMGFYRSINPTSWLKAGGGHTPQNASAAARLARYTAKSDEEAFQTSSVLWFHDEGEYYLASYLLPEMEIRRKALFRFLEEEFPSLLISTKESDILGWRSRDLKTLHQEIFRSLRSASTLEAFRAQLSLKFPQVSKGLETFTSRQLWNYHQLIDQLSPPIYFKDRTYATLSRSDVGGGSVDFIGLGALNSMAVDLALAEHLGDSGPTEVVAAIKERERELTSFVLRRKETLKFLLEETIMELGGEAGDSQLACSADDCAISFSTPGDAAPHKVFNRSLELIEPLLLKLSGRSINNFRVVMVGSFKVARNHKDTLTGHGELIEKAWREKLFEQGMGHMDQAMLQAVFVMKGDFPGTGAVDIYYVTNNPGDRGARVLLHTAMMAALQKVNSNLKTHYLEGSISEAAAR